MGRDRYAAIFIALILFVELTTANAAPMSKNLVVAAGVTTASMNPHTNSAITAVAIFLQVFEGLTRFNDKGKLEPALAVSWRLVNPLTWEFKLRDGVQFHSGHPFTAEDVKFTIDQIFKPELRSVLRTRIALVQRVDVVDPRTVRFITEKPFPILPQNLSVIEIVSKRYYDERGERYATENPSGTGPFRFVSAESGGDRINLQAFDKYWGGRPKIDRLTFRQIPEGATRVSALLAGEAHIATLVPIDLVDVVNKRPGFHIASGFLGTAVVIDFNLFRDGPQKNPLVRAALDYAVDKESIVRDLLKGQGRVLDGQVLTPEAFGYNPKLKPTPVDRTRSKALLAKAGYPNGFSATLVTPVGRYLEDKEIATAVAAQFQQVGVRTNVQAMDFGTVLKGVAERTYPMVLFGWLTSPNFDADTALQWFLTTATLGFTGDATSDSLILEARTTLDPEKRKTLYAKVTEYMQTTLHPAIFLVQPKSLYGVSSRVDGFAARADEFYDFAKVDVR